MKKKLIITLIILTLLIITGSLFMIKKENNTKKDLSERVVEGEKNPMVWYEIPELDIKIEFPEAVKQKLSNKKYYVESFLSYNSRQIYIDQKEDQIGIDNSKGGKGDLIIAEVTVYDINETKICEEKYVTRLSDVQVCYIPKENVYSRFAQNNELKDYSEISQQPKIEQLNIQ